MDDKSKWVRWLPDRDNGKLVPVDHGVVRKRFVARYGYEPDVVEDRDIFGKLCTVAGPVRGG